MDSMYSTMLAKLHLKRKITLTVVGLDGVGKTRFVSEIAGLPMDRASPVCGMQSSNLEQGRYSIELLDLPGAASMRHAWPYYYPISHGILFVYDATDMERMDEANFEMEKIFAVVGIKPVLILTINQDKDNAMTDAEICERSNLLNFQKHMQAECLDKSGESKNQFKDDFKILVNAIDNKFHVLNKGVLKAKEKRDLKRIRANEDVATKEREQRWSKTETVYGEAPSEEIPCGGDGNDAHKLVQASDDVMLGLEGRGVAAVADNEEFGFQKKKKSRKFGIFRKSTKVHPDIQLPPLKLPPLKVSGHMRKVECETICGEKILCRQVRSKETPREQIEFVEGKDREIAVVETLNFPSSLFVPVNSEEELLESIEKEITPRKLKLSKTICKLMETEEGMMTLVDKEISPREETLSSEVPRERKDQNKSPCERIKFVESLCEEKEEAPVDKIHAEEAPTFTIEFEEQETEIHCVSPPVQLILCGQTPVQLTEYEATLLEQTEFEEAPVEEMDYEETSIEQVEYQEPPLELIEIEETPLELIEFEQTPPEYIEFEEIPTELYEFEETPTELYEFEAKQVPPIEMALTTNKKKRKFGGIFRKSRNNVHPLQQLPPLKPSLQNLPPLKNIPRNFEKGDWIRQLK